MGMFIFFLLVVVVFFKCCNASLCDQDSSLGCGVLDITNASDASLLKLELDGVIRTECEDLKCVHILDCESLNREKLESETRICGKCFEYHISSNSGPGVTKCRYVGPTQGERWIPETSEEISKFNWIVGRFYSGISHFYLYIVNMGARFDVVTVWSGNPTRVSYWKNTVNSSLDFPEFIQSYGHPVETLNQSTPLQITFGRLFGNETITAVSIDGDNGKPPKIRVVDETKSKYVEAEGNLLRHVSLPIGIEYQPELVDLNGDSLNDIVFSAHPEDFAPIYYVLNNGTQNKPSFEEQQILFQGEESLGYCSFVDFDYDGDMDAFCVKQIIGSQFLDYKPVYILNAGNSTNFDFLQMHDGANPFQYSESVNPMETYGSIEFATIAGERRGVMIPKSRDNEIAMWARLTTESNFVLQQIDVIFPEPEILFPSPMFADIDGDGRIDLILQDVLNDSLHFYKNVGTPSSPRFILQVENSPFQNIKTNYSVASFCDYDNDGDLDLFLIGRDSYFQNEGNKTAPNFQSKEFPIKKTGFDHLVFGDVVGDGTVQIIKVKYSNFGRHVVVESLNGEAIAEAEIEVISTDFEVVRVVDNEILFFHFAGQISAFRYDKVSKKIYEVQRNFFGQVASPGFYIPAFADLDGDGDQDVFVVNRNFDGENPQIMFLFNARVDISSNCLGRRRCLDSASIGDDVEKAGVCTCESNFQGQSCERCSSEYYGRDCTERCPEFSHSNYTPQFPKESSISDCICDYTFEQHEGECVCGPGYFFHEFLKICELCPRGAFNERFGRETACTPCEIEGQVTDNSGATSSKECKCKPTFALVDGGTKCGCPEGTFFDQSDETCKPCPIGQYNEIADSQCIFCPYFSTTLSNGATTRSDCTCKDSFVYDTEADNCVCPKGSFFVVGTSRCEPCTSGFYMEVAGTIANCKSCPVGSTTLETGAISIDNCTCTGRWEPLSGECVCSKDYYRDGNNCLKCERGRPITLGVNATSNEDCLPGEGFVLMPDGSIAPCMEAMNCSNREGVKLETVELNSGMWRNSVNTSQFLECHSVSHCKPDYTQSLKLGSDMYCSPNHTGVLCLNCLNNLTLVGGVCSSCDEGTTQAHATQAIIYGVLLSICFSLPIVYLCWVQFCYKTSDDKTKGSFFSPLFKYLSSTKAQEISTKVRIFISNLQILLILRPAENSIGGSTLVQSLLNFDFGALLLSQEIPCFKQWNFYDILLAATLTPILFIMSICGILLFGRIYKSKEHKAAKTLGAWLIFQVLYVVYPSVSSIVIKTFSKLSLCSLGWEEVDKCQVDNVVLLHDPTLLWKDGSIWRVYAAVMVCIYPVGIFLTIGISTKWLISKKDSKFSSIAQGIKFLTLPYHENRSWYESLDLARRLLLSAVYLYILPTSNPVAYLFFVIVSVVFFILLAYLQPYKQFADMNFAFISHLLIFSLIVTRISGPLGVLDEHGGDLQNTFATVIALECLAFVLALVSTCSRKKTKPKKEQPSSPEMKTPKQDHVIPETKHSFIRNDSFDENEIAIL